VLLAVLDDGEKKNVWFMLSLIDDFVADACVHVVSGGMNVP
jgi:hypothetical protein